MSDDKYRDLIEAEAEKNASKPAGKMLASEVAARISEFNAVNTWNRTNPKPFVVSGTPKLMYKGGILQGWVKGDSPFKAYIVNPPPDPSGRADEELADTVAHETLHKLRSAAGAIDERKGGFIGNEQYVRGQLGHPDFGLILKLSEILGKQNTYEIPQNYNENAEEIFATLAGIEGRLPKGVPLTSLPEFSEIAKNQRLKDLVFHETSVPYGGIWEGQVPKPILIQAMDAVKEAFGFLSSPFSSSKEQK